MALLLVDFAVVVISFFVYNPTVGLFSFAGFLAKSFFIDSVIESLNLCKYLQSCQIMLIQSAIIFIKS